MRQFRDLHIFVPAANTEALASLIDAALPAGWSRAIDAEKSSPNLKDQEFIYYQCEKSGSREAALLAIYRKDPETLYVSNIVPRELRELSFQQYNHILLDFRDTILSKLKPPFPFSYELSTNELRLEELMSDHTFKSLKSFSTLANKSTGSAHPMDQERWFDFLINLHYDRHQCDAHVLKRWLVGSEGWAEDKASDLAIEFEFGIGLLKRLDKR